MSIRDGKPSVSWETGLDVSKGEDWQILPDMRPAREGEDGLMLYARHATHRSGFTVPVARLRRIGWLDQKGRVWLEVPSSAQFDGGSLTPLLIDPGERDGS